MNDSLLLLGQQLLLDGYRFVTPTPVSHGKVLSRDQRSKNVLCDVFGWNREFQPDALPSVYRAFASQPELFCATNHGMRAKIRFSTLGELLLAHSGFPTTDPNAVFFGPDTYRFCRAIAALREREPSFRPQRVIDVGAGSGAGGLFAARQFTSLRDIVLLDINPLALTFAQTNAALNGLPHAATCWSDLLAGAEGDGDLIISNPPYLVDGAHRTYRDGGGTWGDDLAVRILEQALPRLSPTGRLVLYTGSPIVDGEDKFLEAATACLERHVSGYRYEEVDPDVFGEELDFPPYDRADRIATVVLEVCAEDLL